jgi:hypothetical protein
MSQDTFKNYIIQNYSQEELKEIAEHGCQSGCASGLIYYSDTVDFYNRFSDELHEVIADDCDNFGEVPQYITNALKEGATQFKNSVVWYVAESYALQLVNELEGA